MTNPKRILVAPLGDIWIVKQEGTSSPLGSFRTQDEAINAGRAIARFHHAELTIERPDGRIRDGDSHGHDPFPPRG